jgi:hypothetical protein
LPHSTLPPDAEPAWRAILVVSAVLVASGLLDQVLLWFPLELGAPAWKYGTATTFFDTFPLLGLGLVLGLAAAVALGLRVTARGLAVLCLVIAALLWLVAALYVSVFSPVMQLAVDRSIRTQVEKGALKTGLQALFYPIVLVVLAVRAWRATRAPAFNGAAKAGPRRVRKPR